MRSVLFLFALTVLIREGNSLLSHFKKPTTGNTTDHQILANVKIYSNLAEIILPLGRLPLEFSEDDWRDIRADSITLVGTNVNVTQQTVTEKKKSLNNAHVYVRSPSSSNTETKFIKATMLDERRNLVKLIDKDISKDPIYLTVSSDNIVHDVEPPQTKYYVNFTYDTTDAVYLSYLRSNLNWKTRYQLNLYEETKEAVLIAMADIRNDGQSKVDIEHAELLGGDINLQMHQQSQWAHYSAMDHRESSVVMHGMAGAPPPPPSPKITQGEEVSGLYVFSINKPFSIDAKTNYLLPMFRPHVKVERYASISKYLYHGGSFNGKAQRAYRLSSDRFLSRGSCIMREYDRLVGETPLPDLAAKNKHEFTIGEDADIVYRENVTILSTRTYNDSSRRASFHAEVRTETVYNVVVLFKNYKKNRPVKLEYTQQMHGQSAKVVTSSPGCSQDGLKVKCTLTLAADEEKSLSYKVENTA